MTEEPLVSVVMSVYNGESRVRSAVESLLAQVGVRFEVIAVDDGSTDRSGEILEELARGYPHLRVLRQENAGLTRALVRGCAEARGAFIARQDADDVSLPGRLAAQAAALLEDFSLSMVSCTTRAVAPGGELLWEISRPEDPDEATRRLLDHREGPPCHGSVMFRKASYEAVGGYRPQFWFAQDSDLWLRLAERGRFSCLAECYYLLTIGEWSISSNHREVQRAFGDLGHSCRRRRLSGQSEAPALTEAEALSLRVATGRAGRGRRGRADYMIGRWLLRQRDPAALRYLERAAEQEPWNVKAWVSLFQARRLITSGGVEP